jgi:SAM-dependent methyltransferase
MTEANPSRIVDACQICGNSSLDQIMFLGYLPPVNDFHPIGQRPKEESRYPAEIVFCPNCHLLQSGYIVDPKIIFPASYPYTSSTTKVLRDNFADLFREVSDLFPLTPEDLVIDIGSNDGNLLRNFQGHARVLGITPEDIGTIAIEQGIPTILDYFTKGIVRRVRQEYGQAKIVTATNVFAHIDNVNDVVDSVLDLLVSDGVFLIEAHYLVPIVQMNQFDTIYHEHLRHYSLHSMQYLLAAHGLEIIHAKSIPSHAGSIRVYAARRGVYPKRDTVAPLLEREERTVLTKEQFVEFRKNAFGAKIELCALLSEIKKRRERIYGIGAPSRGTTLIHYVGIDEGIVDCILEIQGSHKIGKYVPGTLIPVLEESKLYEDQPEYALLFSWQIADELIPKIKAKGFKGKFIVPLPHAKVV